MSDPWNLTPTEWSNVLDTGADAAKVALPLKSGSYLPWNEVLLKEAEGLGSMLDLGCGRGENAAMLALRGKETTLFDWSEENLEFSKRLFTALGKQGTFVQGDMTKPLSFAQEEFDVAFSCGVFEYFSDEQIINILKEAFRVTKKKVIILVPNAYAILYRVGMWYLRMNKKWPWGGERPFRTLKPHFRAAGFKNYREFTVAAKHSLNFLTMPGGQSARKVIKTIFNLKDHSKPSLLRQGYLLIGVGEKS